MIHDGTVSDPLWFKDAVIYQLHVRSFYDADGDGVGDFQGLLRKLDYLHDLGVSALWLLPFYPSPGKDDGYDIADFTGINSSYGSMRDFKLVLREAHRRGMRVITELVLNHTSDQHPWFQRARRAGPNTRWGRFYVWSDTPDRYRDARIIFQDFESSNWSWDPVAQSYYWHRFYSHQPDLNFENPEVQRAVIRALDFWFEQGVDGLRLDAVPYLYEREGTMCENLPETHAFLKRLRQHIDDNFADRMLLAEANQWPEDAAEYFGEGDECHMAFHFPVMPRLFMALQMEDRFPIVDILQQTPPIPSSSQWAVFLRNHDELTLEMVTDEERDFMYRVYAHDRQARINLGIRRRLAPLMGNNRAKIQLLNGLLMSLPGTPIVYYGDEIGMGDNVYLGDRNGVRTPMQWSPDRNAGFSSVNPQRLPLPVIIDPEFNYETVNVETQQANPESLLWWMRRVIALRRRHRVFGRGAIDFLETDNHRILAFVRTHGDEQVLVAANLSRFAQHAELDLSRWKGLVPRELFGQTHFPAIGDLPYLLTLGPHQFLWLLLEEPTRNLLRGRRRRPSIAVQGRLDAVFAPRNRAALEAAVTSFVPERRWYAGKARSLAAMRITDLLPLGADGEPAMLGLIEVSYLEGEPETYVLPMVALRGERAAQSVQDQPEAVIAHLTTTGDEPAALVDGMFDRRFLSLLLDAITRKRRVSVDGAYVVGRPAAAMRAVLREAEGPLEPNLFHAEQSNTSIVYGHRLILKMFRRAEEGLNPDYEIGMHLNRHGFPHAPAVLGALEFGRAGAGGRTLAIVHDLVPNEGDAWTYTRDELGRFYERALAGGGEEPTDTDWDPTAPVMDLAAREVPGTARETSEAYLRSAELLGARVAELHLALAADGGDPAFTPEPTVSLYLRATAQSLRNQERRTIRLLRRGLAGLAPGDRELADRLLERAPELSGRLGAVTGLRGAGLRTRYHGDLHLGQVLHTGKDFVIIDFEGEPARSLADRRIKRSPLRDVAGMLRSFDYAWNVGLQDAVERGLVDPGSDPYQLLERWGRHWYSWVASAFLRSYLEVSEGAGHVPESREETAQLLDVFLLEKAIYELGYELNSRPDWVGVPLRGILQLLENE
ncbi:MAG TPA: maltose alpha-D-glucosyltransferase [Miltoncostaeaceae bacterium]|nr:maltose alpha-D-glucosyltransferase [Miltoncostaeaceae bacterium]